MSDKTKTRTELPGSNTSRAENKTKNPLVKTLSMNTFVPDQDRENEALWGDKKGFEGYIQRQLNALTRMTTRK